MESPREIRLTLIIFNEYIAFSVFSQETEKIHYSPGDSTLGYKTKDF